MQAYNREWETARLRMLAWWEREIIDRPCLQIYVPKDPARLGFPKNWREEMRADTPEARQTEDHLIYRWVRGRMRPADNLDPSESIRRHRARFDTIHYLGEAFPRLRPYFGPVIISAILGCPLTLEGNSAWQTPILEDWDQLDRIDWDEASPWWRAIVRLVEAAVADSRGDYAIGIPDLGLAGDVGANLRGTSRYLLDLYDNSDHVLALEDRAVSWWARAYDRLYELISPLELGCCSWLRSWHSGRTYPVQCDLSAMVSPGMFERYFLPGIIRQARMLDRCIYHLDGRDAVRHLPVLLSCPEIHAIQWVPGEGAGPMTAWIPLLRQIQAGGKAIHITAMPWEVPQLLDELDLPGLMIETWAADLEEGVHLLHLAETTISNSHSNL